AEIEALAVELRPFAAEAVAARAAAALAEHLEDVAHVGERFVAAATLVLEAARAARLVAIEATRRHFLAGGIDLAGVEAPALLGVGQDLVGLGDFLELGLGCLVARIEVRMMLLGELAEGLADLLVRGGPAHPQDGIGIAHVPKYCAGSGGCKSLSAYGLGKQ